MNSFHLALVRGIGDKSGFPLFALLFLCGLGSSLIAGEPVNKSSSRGDLLLVVGAGGTEEYQVQFRSWGKKWIDAARLGKITVRSLGVDEENATLEKLESELAALSPEERLPLWIVLIGHGTYDGAKAKFNLPGPDLEPEMLAGWLDNTRRPVVILNCFSASAPFLEVLTAPQRVVITATNSGSEINFSRFGGFLAEAINFPAADLDKDEQVSLLEAFLHASRMTGEFYAGEGRLATEHAVLDDNGDALPVSISGFDGLKFVNRKDAPHLLPDGTVAARWVLVPGAADALLTAEQIARRNEIELRIDELKRLKSQMSPDEYDSALESLFLELAQVLQINRQQQSSNKP